MQHFFHENCYRFADRHVNLDDVDGDEDVRPDFSCPYCYEDFDITSLCAHLEDEHCFESKPAVSQFPSSSYAFHPFIV